MSASFKVLELYSGIGGFAFALEDIFETNFNRKLEITAMDINVAANEVYRSSHPRHRVMARDITTFTAEELDDMNLDLLTMSPPCQPFTRLGLRKGLSDARCSSFEHLMNLLPLLQCPPRAFMLENVKGFESSEAFELLASSLTKAGYRWQHYLLSPIQFGIPNSRPRYYLLALHGDSSDFNQMSLIPAECFPMLDDEDSHFPCEKTIEDYLEKMDSETCNSYRVAKEMFSRTQFEVFDLVHPNSTTSNCFTRSYTSRLKGSGSIFYPSGNQRLLDETYLKARQMLSSESSQRKEDSSRETDEEIAQELLKLEFRFFTPREVARLMCVPVDRLTFPAHVSRSQQYRLLGNSVNVAVVRYLLKFLILNLIKNKNNLND